MPQKENFIIGALYACGAGLCWGVLDASVKKLSHDFGYTFWELSFIRSFFGVVALLAIYWLIYRRLPKANNKKLLAFRGINGALVTITIFCAITAGALGVVTVIVKSSTVWTAIFAAIILRERLNFALMTMIILGIVGVGVMFSGAPTQLGGGFPYFMALLGALFLGISSVVIRKLHRSEETAAIVAYFLGVGAVIALPAVVSMRHVVTLAELYWIVPMIIAGTVAQFFLTKSFQYAPASIVYPFTLSEVLCSTLFGVVMFGEVLTQSFIIGAALIIFSAVGIMWSQRQAPKSN